MTRVRFSSSLFDFVICLRFEMEVDNPTTGTNSSIMSVSVF